MACKRGLKALDRVVQSAYLILTSQLVSNESFPQGKERYFLSAILFAIARSDTSASHSQLVGYFNSFKNSYLRADVVEAMAFERSHFDDGWPGWVVTLKWGDTTGGRAES
jgi:hypothetical protein